MEARSSVVDLVVHEAVEDEDEDALEAVEDGENVGHDERSLSQVENSDNPRGSKQYDKNGSSLDPRPVATNAHTHTHTGDE